MLDLLIVGVCVGITAGIGGVIIGARRAGHEVARLTLQRDDAWRRIDAIPLETKPKGQS